MAGRVRVGLPALAYLLSRKAKSRQRAKKNGTEFLLLMTLNPGQQPDANSQRKRDTVCAQLLMLRFPRQVAGELEK